MTESFAEWIKSPECLDDLIICARKVISRAEQKGIVLDDSYMEHGKTADYHKAVASSLWLFIQERFAELEQKGTSLRKSGDSNKFASFICNEFIDSCIDQRRNDSPLHAYYRHMRNVLYEAKGDHLQYLSILRKCAYYAWSSRVDLPVIPDNHEITSNYFDYREWPASDISFRDIHKKESMLGISKHYWIEALKIFQIEYMQSIRGLVAFVAFKYPLVPKIHDQSDSDFDDFDDDSNPGIGEKSVNKQASIIDARQLQALAQSIIETDLETIAQNAVAKLTANERIVLCSLDASLTPAEIAANLGKKGVSSVSNYKADAIRKLHAEWVRWSQPDSEHFSVAEDEVRIYYIKVIEFCKGTIDCRDSRKESNS